LSGLAVSDGLVLAIVGLVVSDELFVSDGLVVTD